MKRMPLKKTRKTRENPIPQNILTYKWLHVSVCACAASAICSVQRDFWSTMCFHTMSVFFGSNKPHLFMSPNTHKGRGEKARNVQ